MKTSGLPLSSFPKHVQEQIVAQLHAQPKPEPIEEKFGKVASPAVDKDRLRQNKKGPNKTEAAFVAMGLPRPVSELRFSPPRQWRFDFAWPAHKVAMEVEGGVWTGGRHTRGSGFLKDIEKYNAASVLGWRVIRCTPDTLMTIATVQMIKKMLALNEPKPRSI